MIYDRADWHYGGDYPMDLPPSNGGTHIGMFLAWAILHGLGGHFHELNSEESLEALRSRKITGRQFLFRECDEKLSDEDLSDEGNAFAKFYYNVSKGHVCLYFRDYESSLAHDVPSLYHVADTWDNYEILSKTVSRKFKCWQMAKR